MASGVEALLRPELFEETADNREMCSELQESHLDWYLGDSDEALNSARASALFIDGSESLFPLQTLPSHRWSDLGHGIQWLIFKIILDDGKTFSTTAICLLRLSREEVCEFVTKYLAERTKLFEYLEAVAKVPRENLVASAKQSGRSVDHLVFSSRPRISLDNVGQEDKKAGILFLKNNGLHNVSERLQEWKGYGNLRYPVLQIEDEIMRDVRAVGMVEAAIGREWLSSEQAAAVRATSIEGQNNQPSPCEADELVLQDMFLQYTWSDIRSHSGAGQGPLETTASGSFAHAPISRQKLLRKPKPTRAQMVEVCSAIKGLMRRPHVQSLQGWAVRTLVEEGRAPMHRGEHSTTSAAPPQAAKNTNSLLRQPTRDIQNGNLAATPAGTRVRVLPLFKPPVVGSRQPNSPEEGFQGAQTQLCAESQTRRSEPSRFERVLQKPLAPDLVPAATDCTPARHLAKHHRNVSQLPSPGVEGADVKPKASSSSHSSQTLPITTTPTSKRVIQQQPTPEQSPKPTPSEILRKLLDTRWSKYLNAVDDDVFYSDSKRPEKRVLEDDIFGDDIDLSKVPDDDGDDDYVPLKKANSKIVTPKPPSASSHPKTYGEMKPSNGKKVIIKRKTGSEMASTAIGRRMSNDSDRQPAGRWTKDLPNNQGAEGLPGVEVMTVPASAYNRCMQTSASSQPPRKRQRTQVQGGSNRAGEETNDEVPRQQSDTLFGGILRHETLPSSGNGPVHKARFAWSAEKAFYAGIANKARFSYYADRLVGGEMPQGGVEKVRELKTVLDEEERKNRGVNLGGAGMAKFAGCADVARWAWEAVEAEGAVVVGGEEVSG